MVYELYLWVFVVDDKGMEKDKLRCLNDETHILFLIFNE